MQAIVNTKCRICLNGHNTRQSRRRDSRSSKNYKPISDRQNAKRRPLRTPKSTTDRWKEGLGITALCAKKLKGPRKSACSSIPPSDKTKYSSFRSA